MPHLKKAAALGAAAALALAGGVIVSTPAAGAPAPAATSSPQGLDYFAEAFPGLREGSVFAPVTYERFERLLDSEGTYAFLIGGPADPTTRAAVSHIDAVAREHGVDTVYTFDPRLDGEAVDIRSYGEGALGEQLRGLYQAVPDVNGQIRNPGLVDGYLNKDTTPGFGSADTDPYLFIYDKDRKVDGAEDRILDSLGGQVTAEQLATDEGRAAYRAQVGDVFEAVGEGEVDAQSSFEFFRGAVNDKHAIQYPAPDLYGGDVFDEADEEGFRLQSITYPELLLLLESEGEHTILFGGTWCHNTRAVVRDVNRAANAADVDVVYVFDLRLDGVSGDNRHIRDSRSGISHLYGDLIAEYFPGLRTESGQVDYRPGGDPTAPLQQAKRLQVPYLVQYDKDRVVNGAPAPIVKDWIHDNGDGTFREYMTEWWWVNDLPGGAPRPGVTPEQHVLNQQAAWAFADEAIAAIDAFFELPAGPGEPTPTPTPTTSPSPSPSATVEPSPTATSSPRPTADAGGRPTVSVSGELEPGGRVTVRGANLAGAATARVELHSTPAVLGTTTTTAAGTFSLTATIPAGTPAGAHSVVVYVDGDEVARAGVTIAAAGLAATGGAGLPWGLVAAGAAAVATGLGATLIARRRRSAPATD